VCKITLWSSYLCIHIKEKSETHKNIDTQRMGNVSVKKSDERWQNENCNKVDCKYPHYLVALQFWKSIEEGALLGNFNNRNIYTHSEMF
jgi:hypothetical protein